MTEAQPNAKPPLGVDVYLALAAIGWADGHLDPDEADAIVRTALEEGLDIDEIQAIEAATKAPLDLGALDRRKMSKEDRLFVYAVAVWMTRLDGKETSEETAALVKLAEALKIPEGPCAAAAEAVEDVAVMSENDRPARYDLVGLRRVLGERLREAQARRGSEKVQGWALDRGRVPPVRSSAMDRLGRH